MAREWFGFRRVSDSPVWHGFRTDRPGSPSLCGRAEFGPEVRYRGKEKGRSCATCAAKWSKRYPPTEHPEDARLDGLVRLAVGGMLFG